MDDMTFLPATRMSVRPETVALSEDLWSTQETGSCAGFSTCGNGSVEPAYLFPYDELMASSPRRGPYDTLYEASESYLWPARPGRMVEEAIATIGPGRALDLGCGDGKNARYLADHGWEVDAIEISPVAARLAQRRMRGAHDFRLKVAHAADIVPPDGAYDAVLCYGLYHCLRDDELHQVHERASSALRPGGLLVAAMLTDELPIPDNHSTGQLYLRPWAQVAAVLYPKNWDAIKLEEGEIVESHPPLAPEHAHGAAWAILRKGDAV